MLARRFICLRLSHPYLTRPCRAELYRTLLNPLDHEAVLENTFRGDYFRVSWQTQEPKSLFDLFSTWKGTVLSRGWKFACNAVQKANCGCLQRPYLTTLPHLTRQRRLVPCPRRASCR
jgi:hypothetical protein